MLARVQRLEEGRSFTSPFARAYGSFDAFADQCEGDMLAGKLDRRDFTEVLVCLRRWESDGTWEAARSRTWQGVWGN